MLPGLIVQQPINLYTFKHIKKNDLIALCLNGNEAPIGIGRAHLSGEDMYMSGMRGKCLIMLQIFQDNLWSMGDRTILMPDIPTLKNESFSQEEKKSESQTKLESVTSGLVESIESIELKDTPKEESGVVESSSLTEDQKLDHEKILTECFLCAVKFKSKEFKLPIIVSTFMKTMQACWYVF